jgi:glycosyltransferase involved in cell wall biosynthesis
MTIARPGDRRRHAAGTIFRPRLGVLATHPIQYQAPLYQELARRGRVELEVAYLSDAGAKPFHDPDFGVTLAWDIDLLGGYSSTLLPRRPPRGKPAWLGLASRWLRQQDIVVLHGHCDPDILLAAAACRLLGIPYLLRGDSQAESTAAGLRRIARHLVAGTVVRNAAGALPIGQRNAEFYRRYGRLPLYIARYSIDNQRFQVAADAARPARAQRLASLGLDPARPTVIFSGKLIAQKRPLDLLGAIERAGAAFNLLLLGDGPLRDAVRGRERDLPVRCLGFVNQSQLPGWYAAGDILALPSGREPWGLVVNEAMACGLIPVVSDAVGAGPDLVAGIGEVFPVGDTTALAAALCVVARELPARRQRLRARLAGYTIAHTAAGYERAAVALARRPRTATTTGTGTGTASSRPVRNGERAERTAGNDWPLATVEKGSSSRLEEPVNGERGIPVGSEARPGPLRALSPHLGQSRGLSGQPGQRFRQRGRALVPGGHAGHAVQVGVSGPAVRGPDHGRARHLRFEQHQAESLAAWLPSRPGPGGEHEQVRPREAGREGRIGQAGPQRAPWVGLDMGQQVSRRLATAAHHQPDVGPAQPRDRGRELTQALVSPVGQPEGRHDLQPRPEAVVGLRGRAHQLAEPGPRQARGQDGGPPAGKQ